MNKRETATALLCCAGILMIASGVLMALCVAPVYGALLLVSAAGMFSAAHGFRTANDEEEQGHEPTAL